MEDGTTIRTPESMTLRMGASMKYETLSNGGLNGGGRFIGEGISDEVFESDGIFLYMRLLYQLV